MKAAKKGPAPTSLSEAELADEFAELRLQLKPRETREKALIEELKRRGLDVFMGAKWLVAKSASSFDGVDIKAAKAALGAAWCAAHTVPVTRTSFIPARRPEGQ
jgi:hypothetical protein